MIFSTFVSLFALTSLAVAHPGEVHRRLSDAELARRSASAAARHLAARNCAPEIAAFNAKRKAKRALAKRQEPTTTASAEGPHYTEIQNNTCVLTPEAVEGPYYINNEMVRGNLIEDQAGVPLTLDIGVVDINTCEPLSDVFVELWACNATGVYGGYPAQLGGTTPLQRNETFLRGGLPTDSNGIVEITTLYPGFYEGRTIHIHTMFHIGYEIAPNGTLISHAGNLAHIGQLYFDDAFSDQVLALEPYTSNTNNRTLNEDDGILQDQLEDDNNAFVAVELLGETLADGVLGYITVGVDSTASYGISNTNYLNSTGTEGEDLVTV
ncbi:extracellular dioxygenase [Moniliophthora roreri MCA 2997]|uniref:Extracellular dioxygenase n=1 Tax=Moniliophthora roreri (strain MCA 2997) TaxID=1381753 RepID=V2Y225_MONRO|nr:extracellular dioxygenase [Moniliophthora roreri MCA 2997]